MYTVPHCTYSPCVRMSVCLSVCMLILNLITDHPKTPQLLTYSGDDEWEKGGAVLGGGGNYFNPQQASWHGSNLVREDQILS